MIERAVITAREKNSYNHLLANQVGQKKKRGSDSSPIEVLLDAIKLEFKQPKYWHSHEPR